LKRREPVRDSCLSPHVERLSLSAEQRVNAD
jgi:hypothetical protein